MALWGKTDALTSKPKYVARKVTFDATSTSIVSTGSDTIKLRGTSFQTGDAVLYTKTADSTAIGGLTTATTYYVIRVDSETIKLATTSSNANAGTAINISAVGTGTEDTLQLTAPTLVFVDAQEAQTTANKAKGINGAGWWLYRTYSDAASETRHKAELLVALSATATNAGDTEDTITVDLAITIATQPADTTVTEEETATFSVEASINSALPLSYQWQKQEGGSGAWASIIGATGAEYTTGALTVADDNGDKYRVVVSAEGVSVTSSAATLTVEAAV